MSEFPQSYHHAWLTAHPDRSIQWLRDRLADGFQVHHVDGDHSNDDPLNLILIEGVDHLRLHSGSLKAGIEGWKARQRSPVRVVTAEEAEAKQQAAEIYRLKAGDPRPWKDFAATYHGGAKPDDRIWSDIGQALQAKARKHAGRNGLPWPPAQIAA